MEVSLRRCDGPGQEVGEGGVVLDNPGCVTTHPAHYYNYINKDGVCWVPVNEWPRVVSHIPHDTIEGAA